MWMLLERVRFTLDGIECNKIGISYEAFNGQPNFCASPFWSCLHNQLWNFHEVGTATNIFQFNFKASPFWFYLFLFAAVCISLFHMLQNISLFVFV
jgi:hypothetical protein